MKRKGKEIIILSLFVFALSRLAPIASSQGLAPSVRTKPSSNPLIVTVLQLKYHGLAVVVQTPSGKTFMADTGSSSDYETIKNFLQTQGVTQLEGILISHPHGDHQGGVLSLLQQFPVGTLFLSPFDRKIPTYLKTDEVEFSLNLRRFAQQHNVRIQEISAGQTLDWDPALKVEVLWPPFDLFLPPKADPHNAFNSNSIVLRIRYNETVFLLPGDLTDKAAKALIERQKEKLKTDVLIVPHHGFFSSEEFAQRTHPRVAVASCIVDYPDHPTKNVPGINAVKLFAPLGTQVYVTPWQGTVRIESNGNSLRITTENYLPPRVERNKEKF